MENVNNGPKSGDLEAWIKPSKTRKEIAQEYGIVPHTLKNWINRDGLTIPAGDLSPKAQRLIYAEYGLPPNLKP